MVEKRKRRPAGNGATAESLATADSLNESTDLDSLLSAILGDRADDTPQKKSLRPAKAATLQLAEVERPITPEHRPAAPEDENGFAWQTDRLALLDDPDRPNVRTMERPSAESSSQPIQEGSRTNIYTRRRTRHGRSRTMLSIGAVPVLILLGVFGLRRINTPVPAADTTAVPAPAAVTVPPPSPPTEVVGPPAIVASTVAATTAVKPPPTAVQPPPPTPRRVDDSPTLAVSARPASSIRPSNPSSDRPSTATVGVRPDAVANRSTPPAATSTEVSTAAPPTPVESSPPAATTAPLAPDAPTPQPVATPETAPDIATVRIENPPPPAAARPAAAATAAVPANRPTQPRLVTGGAPDYPLQLRSAKIGGTVEVTVRIDAAGRVTSAQSSSGPPLLRTAAEAAVMRWRYQPALMNGVPVQTETSVRFVFDPQTRPREEN
jgi:periplasmic protein TonB